MSKKQIHTALYLPQTEGKSVEDLYRLFRSRVLKKSTERNDEIANPVQLILNFPLANVLYGTQMGVVVVGKSFEPVTVVKNKRVCEIGFKAKTESVFGVCWLYVYKKGRAYLQK